MNEPQELRSVDELFRNTFNNLPETAAESGWDTPSEHVWQHVRDNIRMPRTGWSLQSILLLTGFAVALVIGLYFAFSTPGKVVANKGELTEVPITTPVETPSTVPEKLETSPVEAPEVARSQPSARRSVPVTSTEQGEQETKPQMQVNTDREIPQTRGAVPLPGTKSDAIFNTTEERKAERAKQLELRWKTPLQLLPVPRNGTKN